MKKLKKIALVILSVILVSALLVACKPKPDTKDDGGALAAGSVADAKVTGSYTSQLRISYSNMRPTYNYYTTSATYQTLMTYEDGTYCFVQVTIAPSALDIVWGESDAGAKCNPRLTTYMAYYGECSVKAVSGDSSASDIELAKPFRIIGANVDSNGNHIYAYDTDNWEGYKPTGGSATSLTTPRTADEWRLANAWNAMTVRVNTATNGFTYTATSVAAAAARTLQTAPTPPSDKVLGPAFRKTAFVYQAPTDKTMGFVKVSNDAYRIAFQFQLLTLYADGTYCFMQNSAIAYNLKFAGQGNNVTNKDKDGNLSDIKIESTQYFGNYTVVDNMYDTTLVDVNMRKALAIVAIRSTTGGIEGTGNNINGGAVQSVSLVCTRNWTAAMATATGRADAAAYLAQEGFETSIVFAIKESFTIVVTKDAENMDVITVEGMPPNAAFPFLAKDETTGKMEPVR